MIAFACPGCGKSYELDESLAGKKARCKDCQQVFQVPARQNTAAARASRAAPPIPSATSNPHLADLFDDAEREGACYATEPSRWPDATEDARPRRAPVAKAPRPRRASIQGPSPAVFIGLVYGFGALAFLGVVSASVAGLVNSFEGGRLFGEAFGIGLLLLVAIGGVWLIIIAFAEDPTQGLLMFVPFYGFYYIVTRWDEAKKPVSVMVAGVAPPILFLGLAMLVPRIAGKVGPHVRGSRNQAAAMPPLTVTVSGITSDQVRRAIIQRVSEINEECNLSSVKRVSHSGNGDSVTFRIDPGTYAAAFAVRVDFGRVQSISAQRVEVVADPASAFLVRGEGPRARHRPAAIRPRMAPPEPDVPANADPVTRSLLQIKSANSWKQKEAVERLKRSQPTERRDEVVAALLPILSSDDGFLVNDAMQALVEWATPEQAVPALIARTRDDRHHVRSEAIKLLGRFPERRAIEAIVAHLKDDGFAAEPALRRIGPPAEPILIECLRSREPDVRRKACDILKEIGGQDTLRAMQALPPDSDGLVRMAAQAAVNQIVTRVGPLPKSEQQAIRKRKSRL